MRPLDTHVCFCRGIHGPRVCFGRGAQGSRSLAANYDYDDGDPLPVALDPPAKAVLTSTSAQFLSVGSDGQL